MPTFRPAGLTVLAASLQLLGCKTEATEAPVTVAQARVDPAPAIEPAPPELRGRVALPAGARLYTAPNYTSSSWELSLPERPRSADEAPPRARAFRVVGIVHDLTVGDFVAVTNDLAGEDEGAPEGCGIELPGLDHLRLLLFVPRVYLTEVSARPLELEPFATTDTRESLVVGAGARLGPTIDVGMPTAPEGSSWRWIDADGIRALVPVPDDAIARAWDPGASIEPSRSGEALMRDAEGSMMWLGDDGGASVELSFRNPCAEHSRVVDDPAEVESLRALALDVFYDQSPPAEEPPPTAAGADFRVAAETPLRWPDGDLAGEVLEAWEVAVGVGQTWDNRRCFPLVLGDELVAIDQTALACVAPKALEPLGDAGFAVSEDLQLGGSVALGPAEHSTGAWTDDDLWAVFNAHHDSSAECLRPLLLSDEELLGAQWSIALEIDDGGQVETVEVSARGHSLDAVEDCLEVEAYTWVFPPSAGELRVPLTLGAWDESAAAVADEPEADEAESEADEPEDAEPEPRRERGQVIIIRDDDEPEPE